MTHSPSLAAKRSKSALDLILRADSDPAARGEGQPVPCPEHEHDRDDQERPAPGRPPPRPVGTAREWPRAHSPGRGGRHRTRGGTVDDARGSRRAPPSERLGPDHGPIVPPPQDGIRRRPTRSGPLS
jgi:hypothetical protein